MGSEGQALSREAAASALAWWVDAGVDTLVDDAPRDWLAPPVRAEIAEEPPAFTLPPQRREPAKAPALPSAVDVPDL